MEFLHPNPLHKPPLCTTFSKNPEPSARVVEDLEIIARGGERRDRGVPPLSSDPFGAYAAEYFVLFPLPLNPGGGLVGKHGDYPGGLRVV